MEKVPRKQHKKSVKKTLLLLLPLGVGLICLGLLILLRFTQPLPSVPPPVPAIHLLPRDSADIRLLSFSAPEQKPYALERNSEGVFKWVGKEHLPLQSMLLNQLENSLHWLEGVHEAGTIHPGDDLSPFGLSPARLTVNITYSDGQSVTLLIGSEAPVDPPQRYCMIGGKETLYTVYSDGIEPLFYEADYLRDFRQPQLDGSLLDRITLTGNVDFSLAYTPSGWLMETPFSYPLSTVKTDRLLSQIESMAFESCLGSPEEVDLAALGLDQPALSIYLDQAATHLTGETTAGEQIEADLPAQRYTLHLGNETGKSGVYLQWEGMIYKASNFLLGFWKEMNYESFLLSNPVNLYINDLCSLAVETPAISKAYTVEMVEALTETNQLAVDEYGRQLYDAQITRQGEKEPLDTEPFLSWYMVLSQMAPSGKLPADYQPEGEALACLRLATPSLSREILFYPYDGLHDALSVNGICIYYVENNWRALLDQAP